MAAPPSEGDGSKWHPAGAWKLFCEAYHNPLFLSPPRLLFLPRFFPGGADILAGPACAEPRSLGAEGSETKGSARPPRCACGFRVFSPSASLRAKSALRISRILRFLRICRSCFRGCFRAPENKRPQKPQKPQKP